jgi:hypothetical protein
MSSVPRIVRAEPHGSITRSEQGIPVIVTIHWHHGVDQDVLAAATAWTRDAVLVSWEMEVGEGLRADWVSAGDVRRLGENRPDGKVSPPVKTPPRTRAGQPRARW